MADIAELGFSINSSQAATAAENLDKMSASSDRAQTATAKMQAQIDRLTDSVKNMGVFEDTVQQLLKQRASTMDDITARQLAYAKAVDLSILTQKQYASAMQDLSSQEKQIKQAMDDTTGSAKLSSFQLMELGRIMKDIATGQTALLERSTLTLAASTGILGNAIGALLGPWGLVAAAAIAIVAAFVSAESEQSKFNRALNETGNFAGTTVASLEAMKKQIGSARGEFGSAATALTELASSGKFSGDQLRIAAQAAVDFAFVTGESIDKVAKEIVKLSEDPAKAVQKLNEQYHFLTLAQYDYIAALEKQGDKDGATTTALQALDDAMKKRAQSTQDSMGTLARIWHDGLKNMAQDWNDFKTYIDDIGNNGLASQMRAAADDLQRANELLDAYQASQEAGIAINQTEIDQAKKWQSAAELKLGTLNAQSLAVQDAAKAQADFQKTQELAIAAEQREAALLAEHADKATKLSAAVKILNQDYLAMIKGWIAGAQVNPLQGFIQGFNAITSIFTGGDNALKNYVTRFGQIETEFNKTKTAADDSQRVFDAYDKMLEKVNGELDSLEQGSDKYAAALAKENKQIDEANALMDLAQQAYEKHKITREQLNDAIDKGNALIDLANQKNRETNEILDLQAQTLGGLITRYEDQTRELDLMTKGEQTVAKAVDQASKYWQTHREEMEHNNITLQDAQDRAATVAKKFADLSQQVKLNGEAAHEWQSIWEQAGNGVVDIFGKVLFDGGSLFGGLTDLAKQTVEQIIAYFAKLAIINPILNSIFGGSAGFSLLPELGNAFGGQTALAQTGQAVADAGGYTYAGASGGGGGLFGGITALFSASKWVDYGKSLFNGFSSVMGGSKFVPGTSNFVGPMPEGFTPSWQQYGGYGSALGQGLGIAGGIYAGYNRAQNADGAFGKVGGALAYGAGTYFAGAGVSAALAGGLSAGLAAIPVVGWIALAAMLIDKFSGGNLFGTGWNPTGNTQSNLQIGAEGASFTNQIEEKKKKALFGGNVYKWNDVAATDDQNTYAAQIMAEMDKVRTSAANALGTGVADIVTAAFSEKFDKSGKVLSNISTVLGKTYDEAIDKFIERVQAENVIAQVDVSAGGAASKIAEQYRSDADQLSAAAQFLLAAQTDINKQQALLGDNANLTETAKLVQQLAASNETLIQTYQRLQTETQALKDSLALTGADIGKTGADLVKFADAAATAAGGVQNLQSLMQTFAQAFYSADELARQNIANLKKQVAQSLGALGLDAGISMPDFRKAYEAALPSLTPEQLVQWQQAGVYLAQATAAEKAYNDELAKTAATQAQAQASYDNIVAQLRDGLNQLRDPSTAFEKAISGINAAQISTIDQLNAAAIAAGKSGADAADVALALQYAAEQGVAALRAFEAQTMQLAQSLYGTNVQALQKQLADIQAKQAQAVKDQNYALEAYYSGQQGGLQKQIDEANAQAEALKRLTDATSLLSNLGQIGSITGESLDEISKRFGVPLDKFAADLGLTQSALQQQYTQAELQAQAAIKANDYLANILAVLEGKTPDHNPIPSATGSITGSKVTATTVAAPVISLGTTASPTTVTAPDVATKLDSVATKLDQLLRGIADGTLATQDSARSIVGAITNRSIQPQPVPRTVRTAVL